MKLSLKISFNIFLFQLYWGLLTVVTLLKKLLLLFLLPLLILGLSLTSVDHFTPNMLAKVEKTKEAPLNFPLIHELAQKPFHFIGNGAESIAFASADNQYVLKFFLNRNIVRKRAFKPKKRIKQLFHKNSLFPEKTIAHYETVFPKIPEETALLALHLYKTSESLPLCTLIDYQGKAHTADLNNLSFVIQKKAILLPKYISFETLQEITPKFQTLFEELSQKGFVNKSPSFNPANFALIDDKAVMIDVGKLEESPSFNPELEKAKLLERFYQWTQKRH